MSTYREIVYMVLDELKNLSDDRYFEEEHVMFLADKYRSLLLKQRYSDMRKSVPESNFQTICINLEPGYLNSSCETILKSTTKIPHVINIGGLYSNTKISPIKQFNALLTFVSNERFEFTGYNKWLQNVIYTTISRHGLLLMKSNNPQFQYIKQIQLTSLFEDPRQVIELQCDTDNKVCDVLDLEFPLESGLIPPLIDFIVKELSGALYRPKDNINNAEDDLSNIQVK